MANIRQNSALFDPGETQPETALHVITAAPDAACLSDPMYMRTEAMRAALDCRPDNGVSYAGRDDEDEQPSLRNSQFDRRACCSNCG